MLCHAIASTARLQQAGTYCLCVSTTTATTISTNSHPPGETFSKLLQEHGILGGDTIVARPGPHQLGIHATRPAAPGETLLSVPLSLCLYVNYQGDGLQLPIGTWPRLKQAVAKDDAMNWDLLMVCCNMHGVVLSPSLWGYLLRCCAAVGR